MYEFGWEVIKDLGLVYLTDKSKRKERAKMYSCPSCGDVIRLRYLKYYKIKPKMCKACADKLKIVNNKKNDRRIYHVWCNMKQRCYNKKSPRYKDYGGRGISVCNDWLISYDNFEKWSLDNGYDDFLSIDRINNNEGYKPSNCRYTTHFVQTVNTRLRKDNKTGIRGLSYCKTHKVFKYEIQRHHKRVREIYKTFDDFLLEYPNSLIAKE